MQLSLTRLKMGSAFFFLTLLLFCLKPAQADNCYVECMQASGCWSARSDENVSYCSGTQARCSTDCRDSGNNNASSGNRKSYGAIAYSRKDEAYGYSDGKKKRGAAEKTALQYCREHGDHCKIAVWFYNQCGAVAADGKKIGVGLGESAAAANQDALKACQKFGKKNCAVKVTHCSF